MFKVVAKTIIKLLSFYQFPLFVYELGLTNRSLKLRQFWTIDFFLQFEARFVVIWSNDPTQMHLFVL